MADPSHPDHAEPACWVAEVTGSDAPLDPALLNISTVNQALDKLF